MSKLNKMVFLVAGIIFFLVRLTGDLLLYSLDMSRGDAALYWYFVTTVAIFASFGMYFFKGLFDNSSQTTVSSNENFLNSTYQTFVFSLIIVLLVIFFSFKDTSALFKRSYIGLILSDFFFIYTVIVTLINFQFTYKWLWFRRHRLTRFYLFLILFVALTILSNDIASIILGSETGDWLSNISTFLFVLVYIFGYLANKKTSWVATISRELRTKYFWILLINIIIAGKIIIEVGSDSSIVFAEFNTTYPLTLSLLGLSFALYGIFMFRLFMSILAVMPSSVIVERKSSELNTLTYLNKVVAESANNNQQALLDTVTNLAFQASSSSGAWTEVYTEFGTKISSCVNVLPESVQEIHSNYNIDTFFSTLSQPFLVESVRENKELSPILGSMPYAKSMIIIPLITSTGREGTLVIYDSEDFALEFDDLNILVAFGDNVRIALDNLRLLRESVEKERYRSEMLLARSMQSKLLPQTIPQPDGYSVAAFSIPAMEVGGDYYDIVKLKNGNYCLLIGDVSGKGISAAFYMAQLKGVVLSQSNESVSAGEILSKINTTLHKKMESQMFITMSAVSLNDNDGNISLARAGHMPFLLKSNGVVGEIIPKGIGIGLTSSKIFNHNLEQVEIKLETSDTLIIFTDGLNEMRNSDGAEYGIERLKDVFLAMTNITPDNLIESIKLSVNTFSQAEKNHDDMTIIIITKE